MIRFQKKHFLALLICLFLIALLGAAFYYFSIMKMNERNSTLRQQLLSIQEESASEEEVPEVIEEDLMALTSKVPIESMEEEIILDLEEAAIGADSVILSIGFDEFAVEPTSEPEEEELETTEDYVEEMTPEEEANEAAEVTVSAPLPNGLQQIQIAISVRSKDYESMTAFLENIRQLPRVYVVESLSFDGFEENESRPGPNEGELDYTVQLISYYAPIIQNIADSSGIVLPDPAGKENPLHPVTEEVEDIMEGWTEEESVSESTLEDLLELLRPQQDEGTDEDDSLEEDSEAIEDKETPEGSDTKEPREYTVQRGDTLYSISLRYYGSREGEALIKEANGKKSDIVIIGETLVIP